MLSPGPSTAPPLVEERRDLGLDLVDELIGQGIDRPPGVVEEDHREGDPLHEMNQTQLKSRIAEVLNALDYREREILRLRYGLADGYAYSLEEVGKMFSVTRERVRQIKEKAIRRLRHASRSKALRAYLG